MLALSWVLIRLFSAFPAIETADPYFLEQTGKKRVKVCICKHFMVLCEMSMYKSSHSVLTLLTSRLASRDQRS